MPERGRLNGSGGGSGWAGGAETSAVFEGARGRRARVGGAKKVEKGSPARCENAWDAAGDWVAVVRPVRGGAWAAPN